MWVAPADYLPLTICEFPCLPRCDWPTDACPEALEEGVWAQGPTPAPEEPVQVQFGVCGFPSIRLQSIAFYSEWRLQPARGLGRGGGGEGGARQQIRGGDQRGLGGAGPIGERHRQTYTWKWRPINTMISEKPDESMDRKNTGEVNFTCNS